MTFEVEKNSRNCLDVQLELPTRAFLMITAPATERWLFRVMVAKDVAISAIPRFGGVNICWQLSKASDMSVPYEMDAKRIVAFLRNNNGSAVSEATCHEAVAMLQTAIREWRGIRKSKRS